MIGRTFPKIFPQKSGKRHDSRERERKKSGNLKQEHMGVFLSHNTTVKHHWHGRYL
jgi:hypothetical protein